MEITKYKFQPHNKVQNNRILDQVAFLLVLKDVRIYLLLSAYASLCFKFIKLLTLKPSEIKCHNVEVN